MPALSNNHFSVDTQVSDVISWLSNEPKYAELMEQNFCSEFPEYNMLEWSMSRVDTEASGVDPEYMSWVIDWIENNTPVYWEESEPWIDETD